MARKTADQWFREYGDSHQNRINKAIHWMCVPLITACVIAFLWELPVPSVMRTRAVFELGNAAAWPLPPCFIFASRPHWLSACCSFRHS